MQDSAMPDWTPANTEPAELPSIAPASTELVEPIPAAPAPRKRKRFSLVPWIAGIVMLVIGIVIGYEVRPILTPAAAASSPGNTYPIISLLLSQTRHFKGNANAPVTLIEFSDFQ